MPLKNKEDRKEYERTYWGEHREESAAKKGRWRGRVGVQWKERVLTYYGGGKLACVKCGFSDIRALTIDHIDGNGYQHRRELGSQGIGKGFYYWLERHLYPEGYQTLCMNCQFIKRIENKEGN